MIALSYFGTFVLGLLVGMVVLAALLDKAAQRGDDW